MLQLTDYEPFSVRDQVIVVTYYPEVQVPEVQSRPGKALLSADRLTSIVGRRRQIWPQQPEKSNWSRTPNAGFQGEDHNVVATTAVLPCRISPPIAPLPNHPHRPST